MTEVNIALVTEGISEHWVIKRIVEHYLKDKFESIDNVIVNQIQPQISNNTQTKTGGWSEVLNFCKRTKDVEAALIEADCLIIQIDTDQSDKAPFNVSHHQQGSTPKTNEELYTDIVDKLRSIISSDVYAEYKDKIIFAICIHTIECWLLPIYYTNHHKTDIHKCLETLNKELKKRDLTTIPTKGQKNGRKIAYENILKSWKKKKDIETHSTHNVGFSNFITDLSEI